MKKDQQIVVRVPAELRARLEAYAESVRQQTGFAVSTADAVRKLLVDALDAKTATTPARVRKAKPKRKT